MFISLKLRYLYSTHQCHSYLLNVSYDTHYAILYHFQTSTFKNKIAAPSLRRRISNALQKKVSSEGVNNVRNSECGLLTPGESKIFIILDGLYIQQFQRRRYLQSSAFKYMIFCISQSFKYVCNAVSNFKHISVNLYGTPHRKHKTAKNFGVLKNEQKM